MTDFKLKIKTELSGLLNDSHFFYNFICLTEGKLNPEDTKRLQESKKYKEFKNTSPSISTFYQKWFSKASQVVKQLLPDRYDEFNKLYTNDKRDTKKITNLTYTISDYLMGLKVKTEWDELSVEGVMAFISKMEQQIGIIESCIDKIDSKLYDIESVLQFELFEDELEIAKTMLKKNGIRLAGALSGITLESHLKKVCKNHKLTFRKVNPTISDFNEELKNNSIIDVPTWRLIQRLGDIRNLSVHSKERDPTESEVQDLISGTEKLISELA